MNARAAKPSAREVALAMVAVMDAETARELAALRADLRRLLSEYARPAQRTGGTPPRRPRAARRRRR